MPKQTLPKLTQPQACVHTGRNLSNLLQELEMQGGQSSPSRAAVPSGQVVLYPHTLHPLEAMGSTEALLLQLQQQLDRRVHKIYHDPPLSWAQAPIRLCCTLLKAAHMPVT